ncbi:hypothetical protein Vadar_003056 [Vaccinium darrowii]|uniref:Uncharacterized protein n=1 Tax=Vaccinium darrowii TaxID=229202 RepID=A0ACB7XXK8_9ERIC|nr:hypothetical protein Vadar_003056 [Vaccinium darrowii]
MKYVERKQEGEIGQKSPTKPYLFQEIDADSGGSKIYHNSQIVNGTIYIIKERIVLTGDSIFYAEVAVPPDLVAFGQWLFDGPPTSTAEELSAWTHLQDQMKQEGMELCRNEARITRSSAVMWRLSAKLETLVYEEEKQKADAATEARLAELALDTKKNTTKGNSHPKLSKKTSKAREKTKDHREVKDPKDTSSESSDKLTVAEEEKEEQPYFPAVAASADELKLQEEELREYFIQEDHDIKLDAASSKELTVAQEEEIEQAQFPIVAIRANANALMLLEDELRANIIKEDRKPEDMLEYKRVSEDKANQMDLVKETTTSRIKRWLFFHKGSKGEERKVHILGDNRELNDFLPLAVDSATKCNRGLPNPNLSDSCSREQKLGLLSWSRNLEMANTACSEKVISQPRLGKWKLNQRSPNERIEVESLS